ncbi:unnamed protein product, partial [Mesorhabditis spiculigera]
MPTGSLEEDPGVLKSGVITALWPPSKSKKSYYAVLVERALELHESEKNYRHKKKAAKHTIDLSVAFNVHTDHFDPKLKRCMSLTGPDDTLLIKAENDQATDEWYSALLDATIPARATRLGRPVQALEFFEYVWDVEVVAQPKFKKPLKPEERNICEKTPGLAGPKRLCFYAHTIILCKRRIEPATHNLPNSCVPPFSMDDFLELSRQYIATFGCHEKFFMIKMGRGSTMGACELWAQCESEEVARDIYAKLNCIIEREAEKKKKLGNGPVIQQLPFQSSRHYRDRLNTEPNKPKTSGSFSSTYRDRRVGSPSSFNGSIGSRKPSNPGFYDGEKPRQAYGYDNPFVARAVGAGPSGRGMGSFGSIPGGKGPSRRPSEEVSRKNTPRDGKPIGLEALVRLQPTSSQSTMEETEDSGGTLRLETGSTRDPDTISNNSKRSFAVEAIIERRQPSTSEDTDIEGTSSCSSTMGVQPAEDYAQMEAAEWMVDGTTYLKPKDRQFHLDEVRSYVSDSSDSCYSSMANNPGATLNKPGHQPPRAYSFGARTVPQAAKELGVSSGGQVTSADSGASLESASKEALARSGLLAPQDTADPRQRAFSLGSKNLFIRPLRKLSQHANRSTRHSQTTASGASLASSSNASSTGQPTASSSTHQISYSNISAAEPEGRNRSGSFGSGRSTPFNKRGGSVGGSGVVERGPQSHDHLVEIDFGGGVGYTGSGSVHSIDSPSRSRASSIGTKNEVQSPAQPLPPGQTIVTVQQLPATPQQTALPPLPEPVKESPESKLSPEPQSPKREEAPPLEERASKQQVPPALPPKTNLPTRNASKSHHELKVRQGKDYGDYVPTQINDPAVFVQAGAAEEVAALVGQPHPTSMPIELNRQAFETIQETASGNNSRASSRTSLNKLCINDDEDSYAMMESREREVERAVARSPFAPSPRERSNSRDRGGHHARTPISDDNDDYVGFIASSRNSTNDPTSVDDHRLTISPAVTRAFVAKPQGQMTAPSDALCKASSVPLQMNEGVSASGINYAMLQVNPEAKSQSCQPRRSRSRSGASPTRFGSRTSSAVPTSPPEDRPEYTILDHSQS